MRRPDIVTSAVAASTGAAAFGSLLWSWSSMPADLDRLHSPTTWAVMIFLAAAIAIPYRLPVNIGQGVMVQMTSVPLYLAAVLLPAPLAGAVAGLGAFSGEISVRKMRSTSMDELVISASRWVVMDVAASLVAHIRTSDVLLQLAAVGLILWTVDLLTSPLLFKPITRERSRVIIEMVFRECGLIEAVQYLVGVIGALAAMQSLGVLPLLFVPTAVLYRSSKLSKELHQGTMEILERMADTVDLRDPYTGGHSRRVTELTTGIMRELGIRGPEADLIVSAARVHDIGKIAMPDHVLLNPERLGNEEWAIMKQHPDQGAELLQRYPDFTRAAELVRHHHERWDGAGYPHGLRNYAIPLGARIIAVADSFDAMTSDRPYRMGMPPAKAAVILREGRSTQWDPEIVDAFLRSIADRLEPAAADRTEFAVVGTVGTASV